jgi:hypothetical protein
MACCVSFPDGQFHFFWCQLRRLRPEEDSLCPYARVLEYDNAQSSEADASDGLLELLHARHH